MGNKLTGKHIRAMERAIRRGMGIDWRYGIAWEHGIVESHDAGVFAGGMASADALVSKMYE